jgi:ribosomal protein L25 (general stress protein Ctc)
MRKFYFLLCITLTIFSIKTFAQTNYSSKPLIKITQEEINKTDKEWLTIQKVREDYPLYFKIKVDTTKWKEDFNGWKFYETRIRFGIKENNKSSYFELPYTFHGAKRASTRTHLLAFTKGKFFVYAYDLADKEHINHILFSFDPENGETKSQILSDDYYMGFYPRFYLDNENKDDEISKMLDELQVNMSTNNFQQFDLEKNGDQEVALLSCNNQTRQRFKYVIYNNKTKPNIGLPANEPFVLNDYSNPKYETLYNDLKEEINSTKSLISFNQLNYIYSQLHGRTVKSLTAFTDKVITKNIAELNKIKGNEILVSPFDPEGRQTTSLFIKYVYNKSKIISDNLNRKFAETTIKFGFSNEEIYYELPYKLYIEYVDQTRNTNPQVPQLLYGNNKFYIYTQDFKDNKLKYSLITCDENGNVKKDELFDNEKIGMYGFFNKSDKHGFILNHYEGEKHLMLQTFLENGNWKTEIKYKILIDENWAAHAQNYIPNPYFLNPKAEPYLPVYEVTDKGKVLKTGYTNSCIATTNDLNRLSELKILKAEQNKILGSQNVFDLTYGDLIKKRIFYGIPEFEKIYQPLPRNEIIIDNMPRIHDQAGFGSCMAYALGTIIQQNIFTYEKFYNNNTIDKNKVPQKLDISYFGLQVFTRGNKRSYDEEADRFDFEKGYIVGGYYGTGEDYNDLNIGYDKKGFFYTNECNNLDNIPLNMRYPKKFKNLTWRQEYENNQNYFKNIYNDNHSFVNTKDEIYFKPILDDLSSIFDIPSSQIALIKALKEDDYNKFLKTLFFTCGKGKYTFPNYLHFSQLDISKLSKIEQKQKIIDILSQGKPIIFAHSALSNSEGGHDAVIYGYKKVLDPITKQFKDVFKIQNSWGENWQYVNLDGWIDADVIIQSLQLFYGTRSITYIDSHLSNENAASYVENVKLDRLCNDVR